VAQLATIGTGYLGYAVVRLAIHANRHAASAHAAQLWQAERRVPQSLLLPVSGADAVQVAQRLVIEHHAFGGQLQHAPERDLHRRDP
jgi:hypothetical protein